MLYRVAFQPPLGDSPIFTMMRSSPALDFRVPCQSPAISCANVGSANNAASAPSHNTFPLLTCPTSIATLIICWFPTWLGEIIASHGNPSRVSTFLAERSQRMPALRYLVGQAGSPAFFTL